jgi:DHA1 family bicyclomycin/chloramphenicol resistance-like MFS transporter
MLMLIMGVAPILAPIVGSQVLAFAGWRGIFVVMTLIGVVLLITVWKVMAESLPPQNKIMLSWGNIFRSYTGLLRHKRFAAFSLSGGMGSATLFGYIAASPRLFIEYFGVSPQTYALLFAINAFSLIMGTQVSARLLKRHRPEKLLPWALALMMSAGVAALALSLLGVASLPVIMACIICFMFSHGLVGPNSAAMALSDQGRQLGSASAMMGTITISCGALAGMTVSMLTTPGPLPLALIMGCCTSMACLLGALARKTSRTV